MLATPKASSPLAGKKPLANVMHSTALKRTEKCTHINDNITFHAYVSAKLVKHVHIGCTLLAHRCPISIQY